MRYKKIFKFAAIYLVQVGIIWGFCESYTYFKDDDLKALLGEYWILIYILPVISSLIITLNKNSDSEKNIEEKILTKGKYSPGKVDGNYTVNNHEEKKN